MEFFELENTADKPACLLIHKDLSMEEVKQKYVNAIDKFVEKYFLGTSLFPSDDSILNYAVNILHYYLLLVDMVTILQRFTSRCSSTSFPPLVLMHMPLKCSQM